VWSFDWAEYFRLCRQHGYRPSYKSEFIDEKIELINKREESSNLPRRWIISSLLPLPWSRVLVMFFVFIVLALTTEPIAITIMVSQDNTPYILVDAHIN